MNVTGEERGRDGRGGQISDDGEDEGEYSEGNVGDGMTRGEMGQGEEGGWG